MNAPGDVAAGGAPAAPGQPALNLGRRLYLSRDAATVRAQLEGLALRCAEAGPLRDEVSTDEITPMAALLHFDARLGAHAHTGFTAEAASPAQRRPIGRGALQAAGIQVLVAGRRYGKGSSREHSPLAELAAGIRLVFAASFERIYRQNADNLGLLTCTDFELLARLEQGQPLTLQELLAERDPQAQAILRAGGLLAWGQRLRQRPAVGAPAHPARPGRAEAEAVAQADAGPLTLFEKIVRRHALAEPGWVGCDLRFIHEYYTGMVDALLRAAFGEGAALHAPESILCFEDHLSYAHASPMHLAQGLLPAARRLGEAHRAFVRRHRLQDFGPRWRDGAVGGQAEGSQGISHARVTEGHALPGMLIAGTDSHTPHAGALGCVALGVGSTEMANAFMTGAVRLRPGVEVLRIELDAPLPADVDAKDLMLHLLAQPALREGAAIGRAVEFAGPGVQAMAVDDRATLTNMAAELGGLTGYVAPDARTVAFLRERRGLTFELPPWMHSDPGCRYARVIRVRAAGLSPHVARPGDPGRGLPLAALPAAQRPALHIAYGGSCTAGKRADFERYHAVLAWGVAHGLRAAQGLKLYLQFGTREVHDWCADQGWLPTFEAAGATLLQPACGACANGGPGASEHADQVSVSAINRNFPGRSGPGQVWLASPATVAASALAGRLCSFEELRAEHGAAQGGWGCGAAPAPSKPPR